MKAVIAGLCVATSISIGPNTFAWAGECVEFTSCDTVIELQGKHPVVLARFFRFRPTPHYVPPPLSRGYDFERLIKPQDEYNFGKSVTPKNEYNFEKYLNPKTEELLGREPPQLGGKSDFPQQLEIEQLQKNVKPIDPLVPAFEAQISAHSEAWQNAAKESSTFVVERLDAPLGGEPAFLLFTGRGEPLRFKRIELFKLAERAQAEWEAIHGLSKQGPAYTFEGTLTPQELDSAALTIAVGSGGRARMVRAPRQMEELYSFRKIDPVHLGAVNIQKSGSRYTAVQSFSSGTIKITAASRELLVRMLEAVRELLVEFGLMSRDGVMLAKAMSPAQQRLLIARIKRETETSLAQLSTDDALIQQAKKGKAADEGRATVEIQLGDEVTRWNFTDRTDQARRFARLRHER